MTLGTVPSTISSHFRGMDRGVKHFDSVDVQDIKLAEVNEDVTLVKCLCLASFKKIKYHVKISINAKTQEVFDGSCQCPVGLGQHCSHVAALRFTITDYNRKFGPEVTQASTNELCKWNVPRPLTINPQRINDMNFQQSKFSGIESSESKPQIMLQYDPRHSLDRGEADPVNTLSALTALSGLNVDCGLLHLHDVVIPDTTPPVQEEVIIEDVPDLQSIIIGSCNGKHLSK